MDQFFDVLKKYAVFSGRASRSEYWWYTLFYVIVLVVLAIVDVVTGLFHAESGFGLLSGLFSIATLLPTVAVTVRRLHDTDRSAWWLLLFLVPLVGLLLLVLLARKGTEGDNRFGSDPLEEDGLVPA
jgi:uncharacterized membrane protein YhaH (DUF805 family)